MSIRSGFGSGTISLSHVRYVWIPYAFSHYSVGYGVGKAVDSPCWSCHQVGIGWELGGKGMGSSPSSLVHIHVWGLHGVLGIMAYGDVCGHRDGSSVAWNSGT
jgi:hypothetical protein